MTEILCAFFINPVWATFFRRIIFLAFLIVVTFHGHIKGESPNTQFVIDLKLKEDMWGRVHILLSYFIDFGLYTCTCHCCCFIIFFLRIISLFMLTYFVQSVLNMSKVHAKFRIVTMYESTYITQSLWVCL